MSAPEDMEQLKALADQLAYPCCGCVCFRWDTDIE